MPAIRDRCPTSWIVRDIARHQATQKAEPMDSPEWKKASRDLKPLFAEMARRQADNAGELDWKKWKSYI